MDFNLVFKLGNDWVVTRYASVPERNDFAMAAGMAAQMLFANKEVDNVTCHVVRDGGTVASDEHFFYAEKA